MDISGIGEPNSPCKSSLPSTADALLLEFGGEHRARLGLSKHNARLLFYPAARPGDFETESELLHTRWLDTR
jgi:hypothetical protein